jgi:hypothetical protein
MGFGEDNMSATAQNQLVDLDTAGQTVFERIHARAFFNKLGQFNLAPSNDEEAVEYIKLGERLMQLAPQAQQKAASERRGLVFRVNDALNSFMSEQGLDTPQKAAAVQQADQFRHGVATQLAGDADLYNSVLSIKTAQAVAYAEQIHNQQQGAG